MKKINQILLAVLAVVLISATTVQTVQSFKPVTPKSIRTFSGNYNETVKFIFEVSKEGYIIQHIIDRYGLIFIVAVKY